MASRATERLAERVGLLRHAARLLEGEARRLLAVRGEHIAADLVNETADGLDSWRRELERELHRKTRRSRRAVGGWAIPTRGESREESTMSKTKVTNAQDIATTMASELDAALDAATSGAAPADQLAEHTAHRRAQVSRAEAQDRQQGKSGGSGA